MEKLKMHTPDLAEENYKKLAALFPDAVTETKDENGNTVRAIDKEVLMQEINAKVVDGSQERYQFTWPDKKRSIILANEPTTKTLRLEREKSVGRDGKSGGVDSENIYIEGDNLDALKILRETYLGKVKMIYIDPPYNTGNDFIYNDKRTQKAVDYADNSGQKDEDGNRMVQNTESNGRFHTDWLNMIYPRLKLAKDLLADDGVIFASIDDNEQDNLKRICDEIFGNENFIAQIAWRRQDGQSNIGNFARVKEYILLYGKSSLFNIGTLPLSEKAKKDYQYKDEKGFYGRGRLREPVRGRYEYDVISPSGELVVGPWLISKAEFKKLEEQNLIHWPEKEGGSPRRKIYLKDMLGKGQIPNDFWGIEFGTNQRASNESDALFGERDFDFPKPVSLLKIITKLRSPNGGLILDFFSGSATLGQAVFEQTIDDGIHRNFLLVQIDEKCNPKSKAYKSGYKTICDIGEERIRRAGKKIKEEIGADIDYGFRCFKVDSSNMKDVYYSPSELMQKTLDLAIDNIKPDRSPEDLLFQVMLDLGILLSSKIERKTIVGKKVFSVADGYLLACFDEKVTEEVVTAIAKQHPYYAVFRDSSMADSSVAANFEQIFETYSPQTVRKVL